MSIRGKKEEKLGKLRQRRMQTRRMNVENKDKASALIDKAEKI